MAQRWSDDNPFFLLIVAEDREHVIIDLGEAGWSKTHARWMRSKGWWYLCRKENQQVTLAMRVLDGEQPYYTKRHVGQIRTNGDGGQTKRETGCHGIGKKRTDGHVDRIWVLPDNIAVCGGDDVEPLAMEVVQTLEWQQQQT